MKYKTHREMRHEEYCARILKKAVKDVAAMKLVSSTCQLSVESFGQTPLPKRNNTLGIKLKVMILNLFKSKSIHH